MCLNMQRNGDYNLKFLWASIHVKEIFLGENVTEVLLVLKQSNYTGTATFT